MITILVYNPARKGKARIYYSDIGDYLTREHKLKIIAERSSIFDKNIEWRQITPDAHGDWLRQRSDLFGQLISIGDKKDKANRETFFEPIYSRGVATGRDAWCWNFSRKELEGNIKRAIDFYNAQCEDVKSGKGINRDPKRFSWTRAAENDVQKNKKYSLEAGRFTLGEYRPFTASNLYFSRQLNEMVYQIPQLFPTAESENRVICLESPGGRKNFSCLMTNRIPDLHVMEATQWFPLYYYSQKKNTQGDLFGGGAAFQRRSAITDWILANIRGRFGGARNITKEMIFYYVYGVLHSPEYRARFNDDLKKELPHIPIVERAEDFAAFAGAGRQLAELHLDYENVPAPAEALVKGAERGNFTVQKMKFGGRQGGWDKSQIIYNSDIIISNIPLRAYEYVVNGRSAIEWIMESYRVKVDKDSGIKNDPNAWAKEHGRPRYILDLLLSIIGLSLQTLEIVEGLPGLEL